MEEENQPQDQQQQLQAPTPEQLPAQPVQTSNGTMLFPDGSVAVFDPNEIPRRSMATDKHDQNLAEVLPYQVLLSIGGKLKRSVETDEQSQEKYNQSIATLINLLGLETVDSVMSGDSGESDIHSSALFETLLGYTASIMSNLLPAKGPVSCVVLGEASDELDDVSMRKSAFFNSYLTQTDKGFEKELKRIVFWSVVTGSIYAKVYIDPVLGRPTVRMIKPENFVVNRELSSHETASRKTQFYHLNRYEFEMRVHLGEFVKNDLKPSAGDERSDQAIKEALDLTTGRDSEEQDDEPNTYTMCECHCELKIKEDRLTQGNQDIAYPYIVTFDYKSGRIVRLIRNWNKGDYLQKKNEYFVNFSLLPSLDGEGYGLVQYAGNLSKAATTITRQLVKSGMYANFPGGIYQSGVRLENNMITPGPGEYCPVETGGIPLSQVVMPFPYKEPSQTLMTLLTGLEDSIRKPSAIINQSVQDVMLHAPMGTALAALEEMQKVSNFVLQGYYKAFSSLLELLNKRFYEWLPDDQPYPFLVPGAQHAVLRSDFGANVQVVPSADPATMNNSYRLLKEELIQKQTAANPALYNQRYMAERYFKAMDITQEEIEKMLVPDPANTPPPPPLDPISENAKLVQGQPVSVGITQDHEAHMMIHQQLFDQQSQNQQADPGMLQAIKAHIQEHLASQMIVQAQQQLGFEMPEDPSQMPPEMQNQIAVAAAQQIQEQQAQQQQETPPDPNLISAQAQMLQAQAEMQEAQIKEQQVQSQHQVQMAKLQLDEQKIQQDGQKLQMEYEKIQAELEIKREVASANIQDAQIKAEAEQEKAHMEFQETQAKFESEQQELQEKQAIEREKLHLDKEKHLDNLEIKAVMEKAKHDTPQPTIL